MNISLEWYRCFLTVVRTGSFTKAARELFISQPAVSHCIGRLEEALGCRIFVRLPKEIRLTREGETLYESVKAAFEKLDEGERRVLGLIHPDSGEISIGASDMTLRFYLLPYLERYHTMYPLVKIHVTNAPTPETLRMLDAGRLDFGVISEPFDRRADAVRVREIEDIFVCSDKYRYEGLLPLEKLCSLPMICLEKDTSTRRYVDSFFEAQSLSLEPEFELATSDLIVRFAERDLGVGCVVRDFAAESIASGRLFELKPERPIPPRSICVVRSASVSVAGSRLLEMIMTQRLR